MKGEHISDALQLLRDDIIEETGLVRSNSRKRAPWKKWTAAAVAACLCIAVGLTAVGTLGSTDDGRITAEKITQFAASDDPANMILGGSTQAYLTKKADALKDLMWSPVQDNSQVTALPVYQPKTIRNLKQYAKDSAALFEQGIQDALGVPLEINESDGTAGRKSFFKAYSGECDQLKASVTVQNGYGAVQAQYTLRAQKNKALLDAAVPLDASDEEILTAAGVVLDVFNEVFGKQYEPRVVERTIDNSLGTEERWVYVYAWESSDNPAEQMYATYLDYVYITFTNSAALAPETDALQMVAAWHTAYELEPISEENTPLLSLKEAEEELERGYIFLGHVCPVCLFARNEEMDFSNYDGVEIVYRSGVFYTYNIPYYAFYKQSGEGTYAVTYVPAVKVEGLEEYFAAQESWHSGNN